MQQSVGFFYNIHVNTTSFLTSVLTIKEHSPLSKIMMISDVHFEKIEEYKIISGLTRIPLIIRDVDCSFLNRKDSSFINKNKLYEWFYRHYLICTHLNTEWIVRMEDDVFMRSPIKVLPNTDAGGNWDSFGMGGASIFKRSSFLEIYNELKYVGTKNWIDKKIIDDSYNINSPDGLIKLFFIDHGYTYSKWKEITEDWHNEDKDAALHHGDKSLYDKQYLKSRNLL